MNVLIKEMDVPQNCFDCPLGLISYERSHKWKHEKRTCACALSGKMMTSTKRNRFCPLIELPDHGDLVDRDAFIKAHREYLCTDCVKRKGVKNGRMRILYEIGGVPCRACGVEDMFEYLDDAPVVIPAERSKDND